MDTAGVRQYWDRNAPVWTQLARAGWDVYRDAVNTPGFLAILPDVSGLRGVDIGCGDGHNTRLLSANRGARMVGVDLSSRFVSFAKESEQTVSLGIDYLVADANFLPFAAERFDFATAFMSLMDMGTPEAAISEAFRVLRPGGFLQFSITHPCFMPPYRRQIRDEAGNSVAVELARYFDNVDGEIERWIFSAAPAALRAELPPFEVPRFHRPLSHWLNALARSGFVLEETGEPRADEELARRVPNVADTRIAAYFLHVRGRKPPAE